MRIKSFLKLVEIQTKVASVIPFFIGLTYTIYNFGKIKVLNMIVMFLSMLIFDMTVTALNNYYDYKRAIKKHGYNYEIHNSIVQYGLKEKTVLATIIVMGILSVALGIYLVYLTDIIVLLIGAACFAVGVIYSYGPIPISRTPFGEVFSGLTMGFGIPFITYYINVFDTDVLNITFNNPSLFIDFNVMSIFCIFVVSMPAVLCIANIMLANNICDVEDDIVNKRYTLPIFIGKPKALVLLQVMLYLSFMMIALGVILKVLPIYSLLALLTIIPVTKNVKAFKENPTKKDTFGLIVACFVLINVGLIITVVIGSVIKALI